MSIVLEKKTFEFKNGSIAKQFFYLKEHGSFYWYGASGTREAMFDEVAICFDTATWTLHRHGSAADVGLWYASARTRYRHAGFDEIADDLTMICTKEWDLDELNWLIACTGSLRSFLARHNLLESGDVRRGENQIGDNSRDTSGDD